MLISEAFAKYVEEEVIGGGGSLKTSEDYKYALKAFISEWGDIEIENVTIPMVKNFAVTFRSNSKSKQKEHKVGTIRDYLACLKGVLRMCNNLEYSVIKADQIKLPKSEKRTPLCLERWEVERLVEEADRPARGYPRVNRFRNVLIIKMLYATGLRVSELCKLDINDIHNREFVVVGKSKDPRPCYITEEIEGMIAEYIRMRSDNNPALFVSAQTGGKRISVKTVQSMFRRVRRNISVGKATPHTMRHSYCTKLLECGVDPRHTAKLMGHQNWDTVKIYTHIKDRQLKSIYDAVMQ